MICPPCVSVSVSVPQGDVGAGDAAAALAHHAGRGHRLQRARQQGPAAAAAAGQVGRGRQGEAAGRGLTCYGFVQLERPGWHTGCFRAAEGSLLPRQKRSVYDAALLACSSHENVSCCAAVLCRCPPRMARLIQACWAHRPRDRPSAAEVAKQLTLTITQLEME